MLKNTLVRRALASILLAGALTLVTLPFIAKADEDPNAGFPRATVTSQLVLNDIGKAIGENFAVVDSDAIQDNSMNPVSQARTNVYSYESAGLSHYQQIGTGYTNGATGTQNVFTNTNSAAQSYLTYGGFSSVTWSPGFNPSQGGTCFRYGHVMVCFNLF